MVHLTVRFLLGQATDLTLEMPPDGRAAAAFDVYEIPASTLQPEPLSTVQIDPSQYVVTLQVVVRT